MNTALLAAFNSVATAAIAKNDLNFLSVLQDAACLVARAGTAYDSTAYNASATAYINTALTPYNPQLFDAQAIVAKANSLQSFMLGN